MNKLEEKITETLEGIMQPLVIMVVILAVSLFGAAALLALFALAEWVL